MNFNYDFELDRVVEEIRRLRARRVLIQLPNGLKPYAARIVENLETALKGLGVELIVAGDPVYGSCDLLLEHLVSLKPDLVVHVGHVEYPMALANKSRTHFKVVYIPARYNWKPSVKLLEKLSDMLSNKSCKRVGLVAPIQHTHILGDVASYLKSKGFDVLISKPFYEWGEKGLVFGCEYSAATSISKLVDSFIIVCGGKFHPLGLGLATGRPVFKLDPYEEKVEDVTPIIEKQLRVRYYKLLEASNAKTWGLLVGTKPGQYRPWLIKALTTLLRRKSKSYYIYAVSTLTVEVLRNIDSCSSIEAYIVTLCPRLAIDDLSDYHKPVLTPGEAFMILTNRLTRYVFPW